MKFCGEWPCRVCKAMASALKIKPPGPWERRKVTHTLAGPRAQQRLPVILEVMRKHQREHGKAARLRDIAKEIGIVPRSGLLSIYMRQLQRDGLVTKVVRYGGRHGGEWIAVDVPVRSAA